MLWGVVRLLAVIGKTFYFVYCELVTISKVTIEYASTYKIRKIELAKIEICQNHPCLPRIQPFFIIIIIFTQQLSVYLQSYTYIFFLLKLYVYSNSILH